MLETIERIGRSALTEMRRLLGMLRSDAHDPLAPQPGLDDLTTLVTQVREAGLPVELHVDGEPRALPVGIELSAYRIVQEALTNALKHAGEARAEVFLRYGPDSLELEVLDDGAGALTRQSSGGHGLVGMRERVALYGGALDAGRAARGRVLGSRAAARSDDDRPARGRPGARPRRLPDDPGERARHRASSARRATARTAVAAAERLRPGRRPDGHPHAGLDGIEATRRIVARARRRTRVLMLTTFDLDEYVYDALRAGRERLHAQGRAAGGDRSAAIQDRRERRGAPRPGGHAAPDRRVRAPAPAPPSEPPAAVADLTAREREVLDLLARGHSNAGDRERLVITEATAKTHVAHVLQKLGLRDRIQVVIYAYETGLIAPSGRDPR